MKNSGFGSEMLRALIRDVTADRFVLMLAGSGLIKLDRGLFEHLQV